VNFCKQIIKVKYSTAPQVDRQFFVAESHFSCSILWCVWTHTRTCCSTSYFHVNPFSLVSTQLSFCMFHSKLTNLHLLVPHQNYLYLFNTTQHVCVGHKLCLKLAFLSKLNVFLTNSFGGCVLQHSQVACLTNASSSRVGGATLERSGSTLSLSQAPFNTSSSYGTSHDCSPLPAAVVGFAWDSVPLAVAFCETVDAYFCGTGADRRLATSSTRCSVVNFLLVTLQQ